MNIKTEVAGTVWKVLKQVGEVVAVEEEFIIIEAMKMELPVCAPRAGVLAEVNVREGDVVKEGQIVAVLGT
jgi:acetyl-CoA carboxylase biotin carboxyl carrier protein